MARIIAAFTQFLDGAGDPLSSGKLEFLVSGTTTNKTTYSDINLTVANPNPVVLDANGRCPDVYGEGVYKARSLTSADVQIQVFDPVGGSDAAGQFADWASGKIYNETDIVRGTDLKFYQSKGSANQGNNPVTDGAVNWRNILIDSTVITKASGLTLDWAAEDILKFTASGDFTIVFSNVPSSGVALVEIKTGGDHTATYPSGVVFDGAVEPELSTGTNTTVLQFYTTTGSTKVFCKSLFRVVA